MENTKMLTQWILKRKLQVRYPMLQMLIGIRSLWQVQELWHWIELLMGKRGNRNGVFIYIEKGSLTGVIQNGWWVTVVGLVVQQPMPWAKLVSTILKYILTLKLIPTRLTNLRPVLNWDYLELKRNQMATMKMQMWWTLEKRYQVDWHLLMMRIGIALMY